MNMATHSSEARTAKLEAENEALRYKLDALLQDVSVACPHISPSQRVIMGLLMKRSVASTQQILAALEANSCRSDVIEEANVKVQVCLMRRRLSAFGIEIETIWGTGYRLTLPMKQRVRELCRAVG